ncbi:MAG: DNA methyltransferase [Candidatus Competibacteraceae bacterium]
MGDGEGRDGHRPGQGHSKARQQAINRLNGFLERLRTFRVLDPACGSGNFLYLALRALKDIEHQVMLEAGRWACNAAFPPLARNGPGDRTQPLRGGTGPADGVDRRDSMDARPWLQPQRPAHPQAAEHHRGPGYAAD